MKKTAIIVAGGAGTRMGTVLPKQFLRLKEKPVLYYTLKAFLESFDDLNVVLVLPKDFIDLGREIIDAYFGKDRITIVKGGATRFNSVKNGLKLIKESSVVFVHDAVRCLVSKDLIRKCYEEAMVSGSAVPVLRSKDSIRLLTPTGSEVLDREKVMLVQTPQTFKSEVLIPAFNTTYQEQFTDEATVVEAGGGLVSFINGEETNFKITHPIDLLVAEKIIEGLALSSKAGKG